MVPAAITSADMMAMVIVIVRRPARMIATASAGAGAPAIGPAANGVATASGRGREAAGRAALDGLQAMIEDGRGGLARVARSVPAETGIDETTTAVVTADPRHATDAPAGPSAAVGTRAIVVRATPTARAGVAIGPHGGIATIPAQETATAAQVTARAAAGLHGGIATTPAAETAAAVEAIAQAAAAHPGVIATTPPGATAAAVDAIASGRRAARVPNGADTHHVALTAAGGAQVGAATSAAMTAAAAASIETVAIGAAAMVIAAHATTPGAATAGATGPRRTPRGIAPIAGTTIVMAAAPRRGATGIRRRGRRVQVMAADAGVTTPPLALAAQGRVATIAVRAAVMTTAEAAKA
jgi:hypothetical protein